MYDKRTLVAVALVSVAFGALVMSQLFTRPPSSEVATMSHITGHNSEILDEVHHLRKELRYAIDMISELEIAHQAKVHADTIAQRGERNKDAIEYVFTQKVRNAHSPFVPKEELDELNAEGAKLGGEANGCSESVYGELVPASVSKILRSLDPPLSSKDVLYDLGSGRGQVPAQALLELGVKRAVGVELAHTRALIGCEAVQELNTFVAKSYDGVIKKQMDLFEGSMFNQDMDDATVVYMCATCFRPLMMRSILLKMLAISERSKVPIRLLSVSEGFQQHEGVPLLPDSVMNRVVYTGIITTEASWSNDTAVHITTVFPPREPSAKLPEGLEPKIERKNTVNCTLYVDKNHHVVDKKVH